MADLISRAAAIEYLMTNMGWRDEDGYEVDDADEKRAIITDLINGIPAVDAVPVVHARWIVVHGYCTPGGDPVWACSKCGKGLHVFGIEHSTYGSDIADDQWVACPNCGAKMDGERREAGD